jgi:hypothetical protein
VLVRRVFSRCQCRGDGSSAGVMYCLASLTPYFWLDAPFVARRSLRVPDMKSASTHGPESKPDKFYWAGKYQWLR